MIKRRSVFLFLLAFTFLASCSLSHQIQQSAQKRILNDSALHTAHIGISIYEPATGKRWYDYQGDKYFVPASNTKLATCYAAMKYLGDSLVGARFESGKDGAMELFPSGDPTFLHPDFPFQPVYERLKKATVLRWNLTGWQDERWGSGWSWNDYADDYMAERSPFPVYGNLTKAYLKEGSLQFLPAQKLVWPEGQAPAFPKFSLTRALNENVFYGTPSTGLFKTTWFPMRMDPAFVSKLLKDTLHLQNVLTFEAPPGYADRGNKTVIHSQSTDSLLRPMMHRSDNFFAEQSLLMVSNEVLGIMNDARIIDTLLKTDLDDLPQKPRWVDGSGLSRYNLFTPQDFVAILGKMRSNFGMKRLREILPTGNEGTLAGYYKSDSTFFYAKTGTLSGVVAISGFLTTIKGRELIFSVLVNNHQASATQVRRAVEGFLQTLRKRY
ncbi:D-alanyl-D-alanine carboxypeptidase/D-alanyl-D-alanine-endopeptidase [Flavisolibacter nicotianae]|uniref:D-alanyl-D-alanine carboxypeptidase/D-alanyl-D-alanine-endopeptidase n=1 Tax=Flavisolibacter nicotianae TaxID=2364882 RepID=UPI0013C489CC|nr:D-alanyl-D-alanine carboxypeptidase [Flavisolibacter nicotianae]